MRINSIIQILLITLMRCINGKSLGKPIVHVCEQMFFIAHWTTKCVRLAKHMNETMLMQYPLVGLDLHRTKRPTQIIPPFLWRPPFCAESFRVALEISLWWFLAIFQLFQWCLALFSFFLHYFVTPNPFRPKRAHLQTSSGFGVFCMFCHPLSSQSWTDVTEMSATPGNVLQVILSFHAELSENLTVHSYTYL